MSRSRKSADESFNEIAAIRIELVGSEPVIWREVEVPTSITLKVLHDIIQAVMGWFDCHLWEFTVGERRYGLPPDEDWGTEPRFEAAKTRLRDVVTPGSITIHYVYDFGDSWDHCLTVTAIRQGDPECSYPRFIGGACNAPPEDCGGILGFYDILAAMDDPSHPDHAEMMEWFDDYDPDTFDELPITYALARIANQRNAAKALIGKKSKAPSSG